jgi:hypothetical protein
MAAIGLKKPQNTAQSWGSVGNVTLLSTALSGEELSRLYDVERLGSTTEYRIVCK